MKNFIFFLFLISTSCFSQSKIDSSRLNNYKDSSKMYLDSATKYGVIGDYYESVNNFIYRDINYDKMSMYSKLFDHYDNLIEQYYLEYKNKTRKKFLEAKYNIKL